MRLIPGVRVQSLFFACAREISPMMGERQTAAVNGLPIDLLNSDDSVVICRLTGASQNSDRFLRTVASRSCPQKRRTRAQPAHSVPNRRSCPIFFVTAASGFVTSRAGRTIREMTLNVTTSGLRCARARMFGAALRRRSVNAISHADRSVHRPAHKIQCENNIQKR
jgi:hypothetical protein